MKRICEKCEEKFERNYYSRAKMCPICIKDIRRKNLNQNKNDVHAHKSVGDEK